jgi:hypothetical protein
MSESVNKKKGFFALHELSVFEQTHHVMHTAQHVTMQKMWVGETREGFILVVGL